MTPNLTRRRFLQLAGTTTAAAALAPTLDTLLVPTAAGAQIGEISANSFVRDPTGAAFVGVVYTPDEAGYWMLSSDGKVFGLDAPYHGDAPVLSPGEQVVAMAATPDAGGYWLFSDLGRVFGYGNATNFGDLAAITLAGPVVDAVALPDGSGYYMLGSDGGIFAFGAATFHGSVPQVLPGVTLDQPVVGLVPNDTTGYWLVAADGGIFAFGSAPFAGSIPQVLPGVPLAAPVIGSLASGSAYLMVASDGGIFNFGNSVFLGSRPELGAVVEDAPPVTSVDVVNGRTGYLMVDRTGRTWGFGASENLGVGRSDGPEARDTHNFISTWFDGEPFRWPSDQTIHYVINNDLGPAGAVDIIHESIADISAQTGLAFAYDGLTSEFIDHVVSGGLPIIDDRPSYQPARYGERWAPIWIGAREDLPGLQPLAVALSVAHLHLRATQIVSEIIDGELRQINVGEPTWVSGHVGYHWGSNPRMSLSDLGAVIRHELGHIMGLTHVDETDHLMFPSLIDQTGFAVGDRVGLHSVGAANRHPAAPPPSEGVVLNAFGGGRIPGTMQNGPCFADH